MVAAEEAYSEVLQLEFEPREGEDEQPPVPQAATPNPVLEAAIMKTKEKHIEGDAPPHFPDQASYSSHASSSLCLENQEQYSRITHYMNSRGGYDCVPVAPDGSCMFSSLRRIISAPFEYRNIHLRRQLVIMLANHKEFFFNLLKEHIRGTYGFPRQDEEEYQQRYRDGVLTDQEVHDHNCPGTFSFHSYLMALLSPNMWGDEQVLCLCSMLWQIGLTVVSVEEFTQIKFRHKSTLERADGVLVIHLATRWVFYCSSQLVPFLMSFPVHQIDGVDNDGNVTTVTHSLIPDSVTLAQGYDAMKKDPDIYKTLDLCGYSAPRQFPEMQLLISGAPAPAQQSSTTSTLGQFRSGALSKATWEGFLCLFQREG